MDEHRKETRTQQAARYWEDSHGAGKPDSFLDHALIHAYISLRAFGTTTPHMEVAIQEIRRHTLPGSRVLSVGCGPAEKEIAIARRLPDRAFLGLDIAEKTLERAREEIARQGIENLVLERGDFNDLHLPAGTFDAIVGLGAIHHVEALEGFWNACRHALVSGGVVIAQEYVGPSRFQWTDDQIELGNAALRDLVPDEHKPHHGEVTRAAIEELVAIDPSEAVRSDEILSTCRDAGLRIEAYHGGGCSLLQPMLIDQVHTFDPRSWEHNHLLMRLFCEEDRNMRAGRLGDTFAMFVARG